MASEEGSIIKGFLWMFFLSILLCWLPVFGQLIAGFVGGKKSGGVGKAIIAFILPAIVMTFITVLAGPGFPILGPLIGSLIAGAAIAGNFALFCGAVVGGALSK